MSALGRWVRKIAVLFRRNQFSDELKEEIAFHREEMEKNLRAERMSTEEARQAASRQFGNTLRIQERSHEGMGFRWESWSRICDSRCGNWRASRSPRTAPYFSYGHSKGPGATFGLCKGRM